MPAVLKVYKTSKELEAFGDQILIVLSIEPVKKACSGPPGNEW